MFELTAGFQSLPLEYQRVLWGAAMLSAAEMVLKVTGGAWWPADPAEATTLEQALTFASENS